MDGEELVMAVVIVLAVWAFLISSVGVYRYVTGTVELSVNRFRSQLMVLERTRTTVAISSNGTTVTATKSREKLRLAKGHHITHGADAIRGSSTKSFPMPSNAVHRRRQILALLVVAFVVSGLLSLFVAAASLLALLTLSLLGAYILALFATAGMRDMATKSYGISRHHPTMVQGGRYDQPVLEAKANDFIGGYERARVANYR